MFICDHCHEEFDEPKFVHGDEGTGDVCPNCGSSDFQEAKQCEICGDYFQEDDVYGWDHKVCRHCIEEHKYDLNLLLTATKDEKADIEIPMLVRYILDDDDIERILLQELERRVKRATDKFLPDAFSFDPTDFIDEYKYYIADEIGYKEVDGEQS